MNGELSSLVARSQTALKEQTELEQLKLKMAPLLREMSSLSERLLLAEQREQALLERMRYSKDQMEACLIWHKIIVAALKIKHCAHNSIL